MKLIKDDMSVARVIKSGDDYESALNELERLIGEDPPIDSVPGDRLELLTVLVREYESRQFAFEPADAVDAIEFRMEEQGLRQKDLAPLLGGKNRVSEVLSRKRTLTLDMIRALHSGLGIPLRVLIEPQRERSASDAVERLSEDRFDWVRWNEFPVAEMQRRGWFDDLALGERQDPEQLVRSFLGKVVDRVDAFPALFRRSFRGQGIKAQTRYALVAWTSRILIKAKGRETDVPVFSPHGINDKVLRELAQLSQFPDGPKRVEAALLGLGIILVIEPGLPTMLADGAIMMSASGRAVVGLTLRFDRVDSFWFTLFHELAHARYHLNGLSEAFVDRTDEDVIDDPVEDEANRAAREALIPRSFWRSSAVSVSPTKLEIVGLARKLSIHPAIVAGRVRFETGRYDQFGELLGQGAVRQLFPETKNKAAHSDESSQSDNKAETE